MVREAVLARPNSLVWKQQPAAGELVDWQEHVLLLSRPVLGAVQQQQQEPGAGVYLSAFMRTPLMPDWASTHGIVWAHSDVPCLQQRFASRLRERS